MHLYSLCENNKNKIKRDYLQINVQSKNSHSLDALTKVTK